MAGQIDFYFDFMSPFSYFAWQRLPDIAKLYGRTLVMHPVDLADLKLHAGNTGPSARTMPIRIKYMKEDQRRWARHYGVPIATPAHYDGSILNRGCFFALDRGKIEPYVTLAYRRVWGDGASMIDRALIAELAQHCGWSLAEFDEFVGSDEALRRLQAETIAANAVGVFGVPSMIADGQMWWGNDRFDFMEDYLQAAAAPA
jgi:2-hydroxychromene-2-carboxylate isomerase